MIYLLLLIGLVTLTGTQAVFAPLNNFDLKEAVESCVSETPDGSCPTFAASNVPPGYYMSSPGTSTLYGVIGDWDVSKVTDMSGMFDGSQFNGDISRWNTGAVNKMTMMFMFSQFNGDISNWNTGAVHDMMDMFAFSPFNGDISKWNTGAVQYMDRMFKESSFNGDISRWNTGAVNYMDMMFESSSFTRTLCGGAWESLSFNSGLTYIGRLGCCPAGSFMSYPMSDPFSEANSCSSCPAGTTTVSPNDETECLQSCSSEGNFECTDDQWQKIKQSYSERC